MTQHRPINRRTAERLLAGGAAGEEHERLAALLAAAAVVRPGVQPGEQQAVHAFRAASLPPARAGAVRQRTGALRRALAVKAAAVAAVLAAGGVAVAATTGHLPGTLGGGHAAASPAVSAGAPGSQAGGPVGPSPSGEAMIGLCHAYTSRAPADRGKALDTPAFRSLVEAAGGRDRVQPYCQDLLLGHERTGRPEKSPARAEPSRAAPSNKTHPSEAPPRPTPTVTKRPGR